MRIFRSTLGPILASTQRPINLHKLALIRRLEHILRRLRDPSVNKIAMPAVRRATRQLQRRGARPPFRQKLAQIIANGEAQLWDALHAGRAAVRGPEAAAPVLGARVGVVEGVRVDAVREQQDGLQMGRAGLGREGSDVLAAVGVGDALAHPLDAVDAFNIGLGRALGVAGDGLEVLGEGDLRVADVDVVGAEAHGGDGGVFTAFGQV